ncbi:hypothetical protein [Streptomyces sp. NPDC047009]|uniref:hypothetical protein n=1 Tax=Streptomyces sp. NPDC047009 TaxID=3154496 RepID=UPI0033D5ED98
MAQHADSADSGDAGKAAGAVGRAGEALGGLDVLVDNAASECSARDPARAGSYRCRR